MAAGPTVGFERGRYDCLVLHGVEGASRVYEPATWFQQLDCTIEDAKLQAVWRIRSSRRSLVERLGLTDRIRVRRRPYPCKPRPSPVRHVLQMFGFLRIVPSPEQGASQRIRSNSRFLGFPVARSVILMFGIAAASKFVIIVFGLPIRLSDWWTSM